MKNWESMRGVDSDVCPNHGKEEIREYTFGMMDARVIKWGCGCCATFGDGCTSYEGQYFTNYPDAAGQARLMVAMAAAW